MRPKEKKSDGTGASAQNEFRSSNKGWHPFGTAIILISIIVALLISFWFLY